MEKIIELKLEVFDDGVLVSSPQFPLFHLSIRSADDSDLEKCVLPMLAELIHREKGLRVKLELIPEFGHAPNRTPNLAPHVIARMAAA